MASIQKKYRKDGKPIYYVVYWIANKQIWKRAGQLMRDAKALKAKVEYELQRGLYFEPSRELFSDYSKRFLESLDGRVKPNTRAEYESMLKLYILPYFGKIRMNRINKQLCAQFVEYLRKEKKTSATNINHIVKVLKRVLNQAVEEEYLLVNPAKDIKPLRVEKKESEYYTLDEIHRLLNAADDTFSRAFLALACLGGLRVSEISGLKWKDIDFENKIVHVRRQYQAGVGYLSPKNDEERDVPMVGELLEIMEAHMASQGQHRGDEDPVFSRKGGLPFTSYRNLYERSAERAGLKRIRFHDLRHSACSAMITSGMPEPIVQRIMGHKSASMTRHYTHIHAEQLRTAMSKFEEALKEIDSNKEQAEC